MTTTDAAVVIVVPALNEAASVGAVVTGLREALASATVVVVDDGSTDLTARAAGDAGAVVLRHPFNLGVGAAMRTGMAWARANGVDRVVQVDGDGQHPAASVVELLEHLDRGADIAVGSRFADAAGDGDYRVSALRAAGMWLLRTYLRLFARLDLPDVTSGFRAFGPRALDVVADDYPAEYLSDTIEVLWMAGRAGLTVVPVPVEMRHREHGTPSHRTFRSVLYVLRVVFLLVSLAGRRSRTEGGR